MAGGSLDRRRPLQRLVEVVVEACLDRVLRLHHQVSEGGKHWLDDEEVQCLFLFMQMYLLIHLSTFVAALQVVVASLARLVRR